MTESLVSVTNGTLHLADSQPDYNQQSSQPTGKAITLRPSNSPTIENKLTGDDVVEADTAESTSSPSNSLTIKSKQTIDEVDEGSSESTSILTSKGDIEATNLHIWFLSWLGWSVLLS